MERYFEGREASCRVCGYVVYLDGGERDLSALVAEVEEQEEIFRERSLAAAQARAARRAPVSIGEAMARARGAA